MNGLDLFSGIGGITYALQGIIRPIGYCEIDPYCQSVLLSRMQTGDLPKAPIWDDIKTLRPIYIPYEVDIVYGGFPCQDISIAGLGAGLEGKRSGLFFEILRLAGQIKPKFIFLENVPAITTRGGLLVVKEIAQMGYDCRWCIISAASVGALHRRERWFLLAHSNDNGTSTCKGGRSIRESFAPGGFNKPEEMFRETERTGSLYADVANTSSESTNGYTFGAEKKHTFPRVTSNDGDTDSLASQQANKRSQSDKEERDSWGRLTRFYRPFESREHWQKVVSEMGKSSHGLPYHVDRLRALGNAVVPQQVRRAWEILTRGV